MGVATFGRSTWSTFVERSLYFARALALRYLPEAIFTISRRTTCCSYIPSRPVTCCPSASASDTVSAVHIELFNPMPFHSLPTRLSRPAQGPAFILPCKALARATCPGV